MKSLSKHLSVHYNVDNLTGMLLIPSLRRLVVSISFVAILKYPSSPIDFRVTQEAAMFPPGKRNVVRLSL